MLKNNEMTISLIQRVVDILLVAFAWFLSYHLRFNFFSGGEQGLESLFIKLTPVLMVLSLYFYNRNGLYRSWRFKTKFNEIVAVFKANSEIIFSFILILYFFAGNRLSRFTLIIFFVVLQIVLIVARILIRNILRSLRRKGFNLRHILLVGNGDQVIPFIQTIKKFKDAGINIVGWIDGNGHPQEFGIPVIEEDFDTFISKKNVDAVIVGYKPLDHEKVDHFINKARLDLLPIQVLPHIPQTFIGHKIEDFAGIPLLTIFQTGISNFDLFLKRLFDFVSTGIGIILISPILFAVALAVKVTSKGPIFYGQERMGLDGKTFKMWKFRSMKVDAEKESGAVWAVKNDDRRTPIGAFLRETSLDELPQLFNVLLGDMSLVGPRPERPVFVHKFKHEIPAYMLRHKMKAGITGWAQVNGWRGDTSLQKRIECDIYYIQNWSLLFDLKILFLTLFKGFVNKNAY